MCAKCTYVLAACLVVLAACLRLDPALLEGRWSLDEVTPADSSAVAGIASAVVSAVLNAYVIEFRNGRLLVPIASDTLRFDYQLTFDTLQVRRGPATVAQFRIRTLTEQQLQLQTEAAIITFVRN